MRISGNRTTGNRNLGRWTAAIAAIGLLTAAMPSLATTYTVGAGKNFATPAQINWSSVKPGDTVTIYPGTYSAGGAGNSMQLAGVAGTSTKRITVNASSTTRPVLSDGINITQANFVTISGLEVTRNPTSQPYAAVVVQNGSADVVLSNLKVRDAYVGVSFSQAGARNRIEKSELYGNKNQGIGALGSPASANATNLSYISGNNVHDNGGHGMEITASYWRIESNVVTNNGSAYGGTSGIHVFTPPFDNSTPDCHNNEVFYNYVSSQQDSTGPDGNGIQTEHFCDNNKVAYNVVWNNAGAGLSLYLGKNNVFVANTSYKNATDRGRLRWPGIRRAEILLASETAICSVANADGSCQQVLAIPAGRCSGNIVYDNVVYSGQSDVQGIYANPDYVNPARNTNYLYPNLYYNGAGGANLRWGDSYFYSGTDIDNVSGLSASGGGNVTEMPVFANAATPASGSDGLALRTRPSRVGWVVQPAVPDIKGVVATSGVSYFGAYFVK